MYMIEFREEHKRLVGLAKKAKKAVCELMDALSEGEEYDNTEQEYDFPEVEYRGGSIMRHRGGGRYRY